MQFKAAKETRLIQELTSETTMSHVSRESQHRWVFKWINSSSNVFKRLQHFLGSSFSNVSWHVVFFPPANHRYGWVHVSKPKWRHRNDKERRRENGSVSLLNTSDAFGWAGGTISGLWMMLRLDNRSIWRILGILAFRKCQLLFTWKSKPYIYIYIYVYSFILLY